MAVIPAGILAAQALTGALGVGQAIAGSRKSKYDKRNQAELDALLGLKEGGRLGLTGKERGLQERGLMSPVRQAAAATRRRAEAMGAGSGMSGADLSQLRQEQTSAIANAGERAALALDAADARKATAQEQEIEQRSAIAEERRAARQASLLAGVGQAAGVAGQLAGGVPEVLRAAGLAGAPINDTSALDDLLAQRGVTGEAANLIRKIPAANITRAMDDAEKYLETGDQQFLTEDAATILRAQQLSALQPGLSNMEVAAAIDDPLSIAPRGLSNQDITDLIK